MLRPSWFIRHRKYVLIGLLLGIVLLVLTVSRTKDSATSTKTDVISPAAHSVIKDTVVDYEKIINDDFIQQERQFIKKRSLRSKESQQSEVTLLPPDELDKKEFVDNRIRSLKTMLGAILLKDRLFTPKYPGLWDGYSKKKEDMMKLLSSNWDTGKRDGGSDLKSLLKERREERKKIDPKTRIRNNVLKLAALQSKFLSKSKEAENAQDLEDDRDAPFEDDSNKRLCMEYLTNKDTKRFQYCAKKARIKTEPHASACCFMNGTGRNSIALAGYPLSGHTLARQLLQKATGLCTGGIKCDVTLRHNGFPGESIVSGTVLVVSTTQSEPRWTGVEYKKSLSSLVQSKIKESVASFSSAIYLIRNPLDAIRELWAQSSDESGK